MAALLLWLVSTLAAASCDDRELFDEAVLSAAVQHLHARYGADASALALDACRLDRDGQTRIIELAKHREDADFSYYRRLHCGPWEDEVISCRSGEARRLKYRGAEIRAGAEGSAEDFNRVLECFYGELRRGSIRVQKYNALLEQDVPLVLSERNAPISGIRQLPQFNLYAVALDGQRYHYAVELDPEFHCLIERLPGRADWF